MLNFTGAMKVYLAVEPADLRQGFGGLYARTTGVLKEDPTAGGLFVFSNRRHNRVKILYWDGTGLWVTEILAGYKIETWEDYRQITLADFIRIHRIFIELAFNA